MSFNRKPWIILVIAVLALLLISAEQAADGLYVSISGVDDPPPFSPADLSDAVRFPRANVMGLLDFDQTTPNRELDTPRIVGGTEVNPENAYPWTVSLQYLDQHYCGGSLLVRDGVYAEWVLTAAHCWIDLSGNQFPLDGNDTVVLGEHSLSIDSGNEVVRGVSAVYLHPDFNYQTLQYDLALVRLDALVALTDVVAPIDVAHVNGLENFPATVVGWGDTAFGGTSSDVLLEAQIEILPDSACANYGTGFDPDSMLCAGTLDYTRDTCQGDSGGPLFIQEEFGSYLLPGVVSFGEDCATPGYPGVYADVAAGLDWYYNILTDDYCTTQTQIPVSECEALISFYFATHADNWTNTTNRWLTDINPCNWYGVTCTSGHVTDLVLENNNLDGFLPYSLGNLSHLEILDVWGNFLVGPIPGNIGTLSNLKELILGNNGFTGIIPPSLGNLSVLEILILEGTGLTGSIPTELGNLTNLIQLGLSPNRLSGTVPYQLGNLYKLEYLTLSNEDLTGPIPIEFTKMLNMQAFTYYSSGLCEPQQPAFEYWLYSIPTLARNNNPCPPTLDTTTVPSAELQALVDLYNSTNGDGWTKKTDWLTDNTPCDWYGVTCREEHVTRLDLDANNLTGPLPASLVDLPYLNWLGMSFNQIAFLPSQLGQLTNLIHISFEANLMIGVIPPDLGNLTNLRRLNLYANYLEEELPTELGNLTSLTHLNLGENSFFGSLPASLTNLTSLQEFRYDGTVLCTPEDAAFQTWLGGVATIYDSGISCGYCAAQSAVPEAECKALVALYGSTNGPQWASTYADNARWFSNDNICTWYGVTCNAGHVAELSLDNNNLFGKIPYLIGDLGSILQTLNLSGNQLYGELPFQIFGLSNLKVFNLSGNQFVGTIPGWINDLTNVEVLDITGNQFEGEIPSTLGQLGVLQAILLGDNLFSGPLPQELANLANLTDLYVSNTNLSGSIPLEYTNLSLNSFGFTNTGLCEPQNPSFQTWLGGITTLESTNVPCTVCPTQTDVPQAECEALEAFYDSTDGDNWTDNTGWKVDENVCSWYGITCDTGHVSSIDFNIAFFSDNHIVGILPAEIGALTYLKTLSMPNNYITNPLPAELFGLSNLELLDLENNLLSGEIPAAIGGLAVIKDLNLRENAFSGPIPAELYQLSTLERLELAENSLDGGLSVDIQNLSNLTWLDLSANTLSGTIPSELGNISNLITIYLSGNEFSGSIPENLGLIGPLQRLGLSNNQLQGEIPASFAGHTFYYLGLSNNQLSGPIPNLRFVGTYYTSYLFLNNNQLTGSIPTSFSEVTFVDLSYNQLSGDIPLFSSKSINFSHNNLDGSIVGTVVYASTTDSADYSYNQIGGEIPDMVLAKYDLNLSNNSFVGGIPDAILNQTTLSDLNLSANQLSGELPAGLANIPGLTYLQVNDNNFTGPIPAEYIDLYLQTFYFDNTGICEPDGPEMQTWLAGITDLHSTGMICDLTPPTASFLVPLAGGQVMQPRAMLVADANDLGSGMKQVEFYAKLDGVWTLLHTDTNGDDGWQFVWPTYDITQDTVDVKLVATDMKDNQTVVQLDGLIVSGILTTTGGYQARGGRGDVEETTPETPVEQPTASQLEPQVEPSTPPVGAVENIPPMERVRFFWRYAPWHIFMRIRPY